MMCHRAQRGFSLLEVLVAFVILVAALAVVYPLLSNALRSGGMVAERLEALRLAQTQLARLGHDLPLEPGQSEGDGPGSYRWSLSVEPYWPWNEEYPPPATPRAWSVSITVFWSAWNGERSLRFDSLRLAALDG